MAGRERTRLQLWAEHTLNWLLAQVGLTPSLPQNNVPDDPIATAAAALQRDIFVEPAGRSRVIRVSATSTDAARASAIVNTLIDAYLERQSTEKEQAAVNTLAVLRDRIAGLQKQIEDADRKTEAYRQKMRLFRVQGGQNANGTNADVSIASQQLQTLTAGLAAGDGGARGGRGRKSAPAGRIRPAAGRRRC